MNAATKFVQERKHSTKNAKGHHFEESYHPKDAKLFEFGILLGLLKLGRSLRSGFSYFYFRLLDYKKKG